MATQQKTTIVIEGDSTKATEALDRVNKAVDKVKDNVKELGKEFDKLEPAVNSIRNAANGLNQSATQVRQATAEFRNLDGATRSATASLGNMGRSATSSSSSLGTAGRSATQMSSGMHSAVSATDILTRQLNHLNLAVAGSSSSLGAFRNLMGTLGISIGAGQLAQYMDAWVNLASRLKLATNNTTELKIAQEAVVNISKESRMSLVDLADLYYKVGSSAKDMGINQTQVIKHVQAVANAILISGSSAESAKAALVQYSQAFASNRFGGDELRSVAEQAPRLFKALREGFVDVNGEVGVSVAQMKQLAAEGFFTAEKMNQAMINSAEKLAQEAKAMPITIGQAFTILNNELVRFIGSEGQTSGAFTAIVNGILGIANNVDKLIQGMVIGTGAWLSYKAAIVATTVAEYANLAVTGYHNASKTAKALALAKATAAELANTEAQLASAVAAERVAITQAQRLTASGLMTNAVLANTAATQANAIAQAEYAAATAVSTGATSRLTLAFDALTLGMMRNPFVALLVVLGSFATYLYTIRDSLTEVDGKMVSVGAIWQATWEDIGNKIFKAKNYLADLIPDAVVSGWESGINVLNKLLDKTGSYFGGSTNEPSDITKRAMAIDAKDKADAEAKARKDAEDAAAVSAGKSFAFVDLAAKIAGDTKSLPTVTNYNKQLEEVRKMRINLDKAYIETQKQLNDEMVKAQQQGDEKLKQQREKSIAYNAKALAESKTALDDQEAELVKKITTIKNEASGNTAKRSDFEKAFRENLTKDIDAMINEQASLRGVEAAAVKALIATESRFKQGAVSETGAKTMFQFFDPAAKSVGTTVAEMLKSEALTIEKGTQYFAMMLKQSNGNVEQAIARYHDGTTKIQNKINAAGGKFEMSMVSPAAVAQINDFKIALDVAGSSVTQVGKVMRENYKEQEAAIKQQENSIKAIAKRGSPEEERLVKEQQQVNEYAKTVNADATLIADAYARIADAQQKLKDKKLDPFRDYTATAKELYASLQSGDISQSRFNLGIAEAKGTLANRTSETDVPVAKQQDVIAFSKIVKDEEKATTAMKKFNDEMDKSTAAFNSFGNSGKMAFDGILGGISAVAAAASSFGSDLTKLNAMQTDSQKEYEKAMAQVGATEADKANATAKYNKDKMAYEQAMIATEISGARSIAGATSKMFGEKSAARKAFHGIEMGLAVIEMAMSLKKTVVNISEGASKMFAQSGWLGFAGVAAMLAVMAGLGIAAGSSGKTTDLTAPESKTTGSVLGDNEKASTSIKSITDTLNSIHASEYVELKDMNSNFKNLVQMTTTGTSQAMRERGTFIFSNNGMKNTNTGASEKQFAMGLGTTAISAGLAAAGMGTGLVTTALAGVIGAVSGVSTTLTGALVGLSASIMGGGLMAAAAMGGIGLLIGGVIYGLSKLLGIGKVKFEAVGGGIVSNAQEYILNGMQQQVTVYDYSKIKKTVTGWFSNDVTYFDVINQIDNPLTKLFSGIFNNVKLSLIQSALIFGEGDLFNMSIVLPKMKLALKSGEKYNAENQKKIEDYLNKASDDIATQAFGRYLSQFQQMGEGMLETVQRLAQQAVVAKVGFERLGANITLSGLGLISFSDSLAKAFGGLKELQSGLNELYDSFTSETQKLKDARDAVDKLMVSLKIPTGTGTPTAITTNADVSKVVKYLGDNENSLSEVLGELKKMINPKPSDTGIQSKINSLSKALPTDDSAFLNLFSPSELTTDILKKALEGTKWSILGEIAGTKAISSAYKPLLEFASKNANYLASLNAYNNSKSNTILFENLKKFGEVLPDSIDGVEALVIKFDDLQTSTSNNVKALSDNTKSIKLVTAANEKAAEVGKYTLDFSKRISAWINNLNATQLGSPLTQLNASKANFQEQMTLAQFGATAEDKRAALSGITGYADTYINAIRNYYASSEQGQIAITEVMNSVKGLDKVKPIEELQLDALTGIKDAIEAGNLAIPSALSAANAEIFKALLNVTSTAGKNAAVSPTAENMMAYDALAKLVLVVDKTAASGADVNFLNALVASIGGTTGLQAEVALIINDAQFSLAEKDKILANVLAAFNEQTLNLTNFSFDVLDAVLTAKQLVTDTWGKPELDVSVDEVIRKIGEINKLSLELNGLITTKNGVVVLNEDAIAKIAEIDAKTKELNALIEKKNLISVLSEDAITVIGNLTELSKTLNTSITTENGVTVLSDDAKSKLDILIELTSTFMNAISKVPALDVSINEVVRKIGEIDKLSKELNALITTENGVTVINADAIEKILEIDRKTKELNALIEKENLVKVLPEEAIATIARITDLSEALNLLITKDNSVTVIDDEAKRKLTELTELTSTFMVEISKVPALDVSINEVVRKIGEIDKLSKELNALITTENGVTVINADAIKKILEIDRKTKELNALIEKENLVKVLPEEAIATIARITTLSEALNLLITKDNSVTVIDDEAKRKIKDLTELTSTFMAEISKVPVMDIDTSKVISKTDAITTAAQSAMDAVKAAEAAQAAAAEKAAAKAAADKAAADKAAADAAFAASETARRETAAMNDPNYQGYYDKYVISEAAQAAAKAAAEAAVSVGKNSTDAQLDAIKETTSITVAANAANAAIAAAAQAAAAQAAQAAAAQAAADKAAADKAAIDAVLAANEIARRETAAMNDYNYQGNYDEYVNLPKFARGGITNEPSIFGEAGIEAAVPLPDGRSIPVKIMNHSNDASINSEETIAELKAQNNKLETLVNTLMATSKAERDKTQELIDAMNGLRVDTRLKNKA